jgi:hypothetical protein
MFIHSYANTWLTSLIWQNKVFTGKLDKHKMPHNLHVIFSKTFYEYYDKRKGFKYIERASINKFQLFDFELHNHILNIF